MIDWVVKPADFENNRGLKEENTRRKRTCKKTDSRKMVGSFNKRDEKKSEEEKQNFSLRAIIVCLRCQDFFSFYCV